MKKNKKLLFGIISGVLILSLALGAVVLFVLHNKNEDEDDGYTKTIVFLGDSIAEGILGSSPFSERDSYCYYGIIGRSNNYRYIESSVSGDTTVNMYNRLTRTDTPALERQYWVTQADIIHISILGNDLLGGDIGKTAREAMEGNNTNINTMLARARQYFDLSIARIKELNPDAVVLVSTLYNPLDAASTLLTQAQKDALIDLGDGDPSIIRTAGTDLLTRLNGVIYDYLDANPNAYEVVDVYTAFDDKYIEDYTEGTALIYGDWLHPSNEGHALMAKLLQEKLVQLGLADDAFALPRYKNLRIEQLERLFTGTSVNISSVSTAIASADTFVKVTDAYFDSVRGVTPIYTNKPIIRHKGEVFTEARVYNLSSIMMGADDLASYADKEQSCFTFNTDGTFSIKLVPDSLILSIANAGLYLMLKDGGLNLSDGLGTGNFGTGIEVYLSNVLPGFDLHYLQKDLELLTSLGVYVNGFDFQSEEMIALTTSLQETMTIPKGFSIPEDLTIEIKGYYFVETAGSFTNIHMCVGNVSQDGYPFLYATVHTEEDGSTWIETSIEVSKITITAR